MKKSQIQKMKEFLSIFMLTSSLLVYTQTLIAQTTLLSLDLLEFKGKVDNGDVLLSWEKDYSNSQAYDDSLKIQRAGNDGFFEYIGSASSWEGFRDENPNEEMNYYRLVSNNSKGELLYSRTIAVEYKTPNQLIISPNPASDLVEIGFRTRAEEGAIIQFLDKQGNYLNQVQIDTPLGGYQKETVDLKDYSSGIYIVRIIQGKDVRTRKLVVL